MHIATNADLVRGDRPAIPLLQPLLNSRNREGGKGCSDFPGDSWTRRFDAWAQHADTVFSLADLEQASVFVVPIDWHWVRGLSWASRPDRSVGAECREIVRAAQAKKLPSIAFFSGDRSCDQVGLENVLVCREGAFRSLLGPNDLATPAFVEDLVHHFLGGKLHIRPLAPEPTIGFCGLAGTRTGLNVRLREQLFRATTLTRERRLEPSQFTGENLRARAIGLLEDHPLCRTNFVLRGTSVFFTEADPMDLVDIRQQYVNNLVASDYSLCIRGSGNYSFRLYETLCMGRIPIIIDTDLALPAADKIDWKETGVWIDQSDVGHIGDIVADFHAGLSRQSFEALQRNARHVWQEHLSPVGWLSAFPRRIDSWLAAATPA